MPALVRLCWWCVSFCCKTPRGNDRSLSYPGSLEMLTADTAPKYPLVFKDTRHWSHLDSWVWLVVRRTSVLKALLHFHLCWEQLTTDPPRQHLLQLLMVLNHVAKPSKGGCSWHFLEVLTSVQGKSLRGITGHPVPLHWGGHRTLASSPALSASSIWTAAPGPCPLLQRLHWFWGLHGALGTHPVAHSVPDILPVLCSPAPQRHLLLFWGCCAGSASLQRLLVWVGTEPHTGWCSLVFIHAYVLQFGYIWRGRFPFWL